MGLGRRKYTEALASLGDVDSSDSMRENKRGVDKGEGEGALAMD